MSSLALNHQVRYITNEAGEATDVLIPLSLWEKMLSQLQDSESGLAALDEYEPHHNLLADLKASLQEAKLGQTLPVSELWDDLAD